MEPIHPMPDNDSRRKRAIYRAEHRGTKELDLLLGQFAHALFDDKIAGAPEAFSDEERLAIVEWLIAQPDHALQPWLIAGESAPDGVPAIVRAALIAFEYESRPQYQ